MVRLAQDRDDVDSTFRKTLVQRIALKHWLFRDELTEESLDGSGEQLKGMSVGDAEWQECHIVPMNKATMWC